MVTSNEQKQSVFFEISDKKYAEELRKDIVSSGVPENLVSMKKVRGMDSYKVVVDDGMKHITKIIRMLHSEEYDLDYPQIEELLKIKIEI